MKFVIVQMLIENLMGILMKLCSLAFAHEEKNKKHCSQSSNLEDLDVEVLAFL